MNTKTIEVPGMTASSVALGVMRMDGIDAKQAVTMVKAAVDNGIDFFDTADIYGFLPKKMHFSSEVFGTALAASGLPRDSIKIQTKVGIRTHYSDSGTDAVDFSKQNIIAEVEAELKVLKTDYVDSLLLHRPDVLVEPDEVSSAFAQLLEQGKVRHFGVSNMSSQMVEYIQTSIAQPLEFNQLQYSMTHSGLVDEQILLNNDDEGAASRTSGLLPYMAQHGMVLQAWSPFQSGTQNGPYIENPHYEKLNDALKEVAAAHHTSANAIATAWLLRLPLPVQVIAGTMNPNRLAEISDGMGLVLDRGEWYGLYKAAGHRLP